jgi:mannose-6-phosphate isomerase-like protein (cupin superfamily)
MSIPPARRTDAEHYTWGSGCDGWHLVKQEGLSVIEERMPPGSAEVMHFHNRTQQFFYILAGEAVMELEGEAVSLARGVKACIFQRGRRIGSETHRTSRWNSW